MTRPLPVLRAFACVLALLAAFPLHAQERPVLIVVDPGHGGTQDGASSPNGEKEKVVALQISRRLRDALQRELGAEVILTRESDADLLLAERVAFANAKAPDLFISVHANSMPTRKTRLTVHGIETYFLSASASGVDAARIADRENAEGPSQVTRPGSDILAFILADLQRTEAHQDASRLAYAVQEALISRTGAHDRGVHQAPFYVLNGLQASAILVEVGYISHPKESLKLLDGAYQEKLARGISAGVRGFLEERGRKFPTVSAGTPE